MRYAIVLFLVLAGCSPSGRFDHAAWRDADLSGRARAEMLPDFLKRYPLEGRTRSEVIGLLGEPTPTDKWNNADMIYVLGNDGGDYVAIDHEWLLIDLNQRQRVLSYKRVFD